MSATNTPSALYGSSFGPRTPRTPTCTSLFFSDTADLSQSGLKESEGANSADEVVVGTDVGATFKNEADSSSTDSQTNVESASSSNSHPAHPLSSMICISPLASSKKGGNCCAALPSGSQQHPSGIGESLSGTPINFSKVFESPRPQAHGTSKSSSLRSIPLLGNDTLRGKAKHLAEDFCVNGHESKKGSHEHKLSLDVVNMAERDLMEDEDLSVLLQLASSTPGKGTPVFRSPQGKGIHHGEAGTGARPPSSLHLPIIGRRDGRGGGPHSKLSRNTAFRDNPSVHVDQYKAPPLAIRSNLSRDVLSGPGVVGSNEEQPNGAEIAKGSFILNSVQGQISSGKGNSSAQSPVAKKVKASTEDGIIGGRQQGKNIAAQTDSSSNMTSGIHPPAHHQHSYSHMALPGAPPRSGPVMLQGSTVHSVMGTSSSMGSVPRKTNNYTAAMPYGMPPAAVQKPPHPNIPHPPHGVYSHHPAHLPLPPHISSMTGHPPYHMLPYPPPHPHTPHSHMPMFASQQGSKTKSVPKKGQKIKLLKSGAKRPLSVNDGKGHEVVGKKQKKSSPKKRAGKNASSTANATLSPDDRERAAAAIQKVNAASGGKNDKAAALAAAILRGVTMRPSGKWVRIFLYISLSCQPSVFGQDWALISCSDKT